MVIELPESWVSDIAIHPGELPGEEIEARGITRSEAASAMGRPVRVVSDIVSGRRDITAALAVELERALDQVPARYWLNLQTEFRPVLGAPPAASGLAVAGWAGYSA